MHNLFSSKNKIITFVFIFLLFSSSAFTAGNEHNDKETSDKKEQGIEKPDVSTTQSSGQTKPEKKYFEKRYFGPSIGFGFSGPINPDESGGYELRKSFYFNVGVNFLNFSSKWFGEEFILTYKRIHLNSDDIEGYDMISFKFNGFLNIYGFLLNLSIAFNTHLHKETEDAGNPIFGMCFGTGIGYIFVLGRNTIMPVKFNFEIQGFHRRCSIVYTAYLQFDILFAY